MLMHPGNRQLFGGFGQVSFFALLFLQLMDDHVLHFHKADIGVPGGVEIPIVGFSATTSGSFSGSAIVDQSEEEDLLENKFYVNIHTAAHPGGEIRGQLIKQ